MERNSVRSLDDDSQSQKRVDGIHQNLKEGLRVRDTDYEIHGGPNENRRDIEWKVVRKRRLGHRTKETSPM